MNETDIVRRSVPRFWRAFRENVRCRHDAARLVVDFDQFRGIARLYVTFRNNEGHVIADVLNHIIAAMDSSVARTYKAIARPRVIKQATGRIRRPLISARIDRQYTRRCSAPAASMDLILAFAWGIGHAAIRLTWTVEIVRIPAAAAQ